MRHLFLRHLAMTLVLLSLFVGTGLYTISAASGRSAIAPDAQRIARPEWMDSMCLTELCDAERYQVEPDEQHGGVDWDDETERSIKVMVPSRNQRRCCGDCFLDMAGIAPIRSLPARWHAPPTGACRVY